ncbi:hypothetical protein R3P38DRAFT_1577493 [Favolaschia claudopus]|uniref:Uncharacterized protein n=1 Tax=Favolaschia claudopus TaxID=2862362 RepID=A0AAW0AI58_9AGAR
MWIYSANALSDGRRDRLASVHTSMLSKQPCWILSTTSAVGTLEFSTRRLSQLSASWRIFVQCLQCLVSSRWRLIQKRLSDTPKTPGYTRGSQSLDSAYPSSAFFETPAQKRKDGAQTRSQLISATYGAYWQFQHTIWSIHALRTVPPCLRGASQAVCSFRRSRNQQILEHCGTLSGHCSSLVESFEPSSFIKILKLKAPMHASLDCT